MVDFRSRLNQLRQILIKGFAKIRNVASELLRKSSLFLLWFLPEIIDEVLVVLFVVRKKVNFFFNKNGFVDQVVPQNSHSL